MGIEVVSLVLTVASTAYSVYESEEAKDEAERQAKLKEQQVELQRQQEERRARRQARIKQAQIAAAGAAAGVGGSIVDAPTAGIGVSLEEGLSLLEKQTQVQTEQIGAELGAKKASLTSQQIQDLGVGTRTTLDIAKGINFSDEIGE